MSSLQFISVVGIPVTVLLVAVALIAFARPDADEGIYPAYLALVSLLSIYLFLLALAALGESIAQHLVLGDARDADLGSTGSFGVYYSLFASGGASAIAAFAALTVLMGASLGFHTQRRAELLAVVPRGSTPERIERAYRAAVCFAMVSLVAVGGVLAGNAGYNFFSQPVAGGRGDELRDLAMGSLLAYGGLVLVAGLIFRANVWAIRGNDESSIDPDADLVEMDEA
jgi:hypothetical protein